MANRLDTELLITAGVNGLTHIDNLINTIGQAGGNTDQLREAAEQLRLEWDNLSADEQAERLRNLGNAANQGADDVGLLENQTENTTSAFDRMRTGLMALAAALGLAFIIGKIKSFFTDAIEGAAEFEQQLATVQAVSGATVEQMARIKTASEELGKSTRYNATEAAEGFEILARAGLNTEQALQTIPSVLALAQGNSLELAEAASYVTNAVQGMGLEFSDAGRVTDVMAKAAASANTDVAGMGAALSYAAPSAAALGLSLEDTAAYIGKFADAGIDASRAGTSFNGMLSQFSNSTSAFRRELANIGITTGDFNEAIAQLAASGDKGQVAINALGMEAGPALKALLAQGIPALDELKAKLYAAGGTAQEQADVMNNTWQGALAGLGSAWDYLKNTLGESFLEPMTESFKGLGEMIVGLVDSGKIGKLGDSLATLFKESATAVMDFVSRLDFGAMIDKLSNAFETLRGIGVGINGAFEALSIVFNAFKAGLLAVGVAVSMVITVFVELNKLTLDVGRAIAGFFGITSTAADGMSNALGGALQASEDFREFATKEISAASDSMGKSFNSIAGTAEDSAIDASHALGMIPEEYATISEGVLQQIQRDFDAILQAAQDTGADAATQAAQVQAEVIRMMEGFDQPEQFAALINSITATGKEAVVGGALLEQMGEAAARGGTEAQAAAESAKTAVAGLGDESSRQAAATADAINNAFQALDIDVAQSLTGVNSKTQQTFDLIAVGAKSVGESSYSAAEKAKLLASLFAEGMNAAKTAEEFKVLNDMVSAHGLTSVVTAEQAQILKVGMEGGAEAVKAAADAEAKQTAELEKNAEAAAKNAEKSRESAVAKKLQADATDNASEATDKSARSESASLAFVQQVTTAIKGKISALEQLAGTTGQTDAAFGKLMNSMGFVDGYRFSGMADFANQMNRVHEAVDRQVLSFQAARSKAEDMTKALSGTNVTSRDLTNAQHALRQATDANVQGLIRMDQATLDNLKNAIDGTKKKMEDLAQQAKDTADQLEGRLATLKGDDSRALEIQQTKDLSKLEALLADARKRGNTEEIKHYNEALTLQREINKEERKQADRDKKTARNNNSNSNNNNSNRSNRDETMGGMGGWNDGSGPSAADIAATNKAMAEHYAAELKRMLANGASASDIRDQEQLIREFGGTVAPPKRTPAPTKSTNYSSSDNLSANDIINSLDARVIELIETRGVQAFAKQLTDEAKRRS